jgi:hypothetical protein
MSESVLINRPTISLPEKSVKPSEYAVFIKSEGMSFGTKIIVWPAFCNKLATLFHLEGKLIKDLIKYVVHSGKEEIVTECTKEIAETLVHRANQIVANHNCTVSITFLSRSVD